MTWLAICVLSVFVAILFCLYLGQAGQIKDLEKDMDSTMEYVNGISHDLDAIREEVYGPVTDVFPAPTDADVKEIESTLWEES